MYFIAKCILFIFSFVFQFKCCGMSMEKSPGYEVWSKQNSHFQGLYKIPATCCKTKDDGLRDRCQKDPTENNAYLEVCN